MKFATYLKKLDEEDQPLFQAWVFAQGDEIDHNQNVAGWNDTWQTWCESLGESGDEPEDDDELTNEAVVGGPLERRMAEDLPAYKGPPTPDRFMQWRDTSSYNVNAGEIRGKTAPKTWELETIEGFIVIVTRHVHLDPDQWMLRTRPHQLFEGHILESLEPQEARDEALALVRERLVAHSKAILGEVKEPIG